jgi:hypothetical protein
MLKQKLLHMDTLKVAEQTALGCMLYSRLCDSATQHSLNTGFLLTLVIA